MLEPKPGEMKVLKTVSAISGAVIGSLIGVAAGGPAGFVLGSTTGPIVGAALAGGTPGIVEGGLSSSKGAILVLARASSVDIRPGPIWSTVSGLRQVASQGGANPNHGVT